MTQMLISIPKWRYGVCVSENHRNKSVKPQHRHRGQHTILKNKECLY